MRNRKIEINPNLQKLKTKARENLESELANEIYLKDVSNQNLFLEILSKTKGLKDLN